MPPWGEKLRIVPGCVRHHRVCTPPLTIGTDHGGPSGVRRNRRRTHHGVRRQPPPGKAPLLPVADRGFTVPDCPVPELYGDRLRHAVHRVLRETRRPVRRHQRGELRAEQRPQRPDLRGPAGQRRQQGQRRMVGTALLAGLRQDGRRPQPHLLGAPGELCRHQDDRGTGPGQAVGALAALRRQAVGLPHARRHRVAARKPAYAQVEQQPGVGEPHAQGAQCLRQHAAQRIAVRQPVGEPPQHGHVPGEAVTGEHGARLRRHQVARRAAARCGRSAPAAPAG
jgi:hypothetical protein